MEVNRICYWLCCCVMEKQSGGADLKQPPTCSYTAYVKRQMGLMVFPLVKLNPRLTSRIFLFPPWDAECLP